MLQSYSYFNRRFYALILVPLLKGTGTECVVILLGKFCLAAQSLLKRQWNHSSLCQILSQKTAVYQAIQTRHQMHQTHENMDFHENTDSVNDTEVIEALFTPYTDAPMAQQNMTMKILID